MRRSERNRTDIYRLGVHASIAGGISKSIDRAASLKCSTIQIFSHSPRQWRKTIVNPEEAERFKLLRHRYDINPVFVHVSYLINLASHSGPLLKKSIDLLSYELQNADRIGAEYVVLHTGSAQGEDAFKARARSARAILRAVHGNHTKATILLENTSGKKGDITSSVQALAEIIDACQSDCISGICIDTCHAFSSGYELRTTEGVEQLLDEVKKYVGLDRLKLIHLNDSKGPVGSGIDRHEHIGKGFIGMTGFEKLLSDKRITGTPMILETPKNHDDDDKKNLKKVSGILRSL